MPAAPAPVMADHPLIARFRDGGWVVPLAAGGEPGLPAAWLAVPLAHGDRLAGFVLAAPPRAAFKLEREVFDLLRILGRQTATYVAEQRATERLLQARQLHEYGKRFAFVAHDIKNVSSQLSLLLSNAETYLDNPDFQRDMLATIRASVDKIGALIKRLQVPQDTASRAVIMPAARLEAIVAGIRRGAGASVSLETDGRDVGVAMSAAAFDAIITHLLDNALQATESAMDAARTARHASRRATRSGGADPAWRADEAPPVRLVLRHERRRAVIEIIDGGCGMTPEFVRDELFRPFRTSKADGSGIGAFQARDLLREAGGDLIVESALDRGTAMRILLPLVEDGAIGRDVMAAGSAAAGG